MIAAGCDVNDHGDLTRQLWAPDPTNSYAQNLGEVVASTHELTAAASQVLSGTENVNRRNSGPTIAQLAPALAELVPHPDCWGITIGQLDPAHAASDPTAVPRLVDALAAAFAAPRPT